MVKLPAMEAGGPYVMKISGVNSIEIKDVLVGEVWLCSGQSNMELNVQTAGNGKAEIDAANFDRLRFFYIQKNVSATPLSDADSQWRPCTSEHVYWTSAVGYFFGREIHKYLDVPVGLIVSCWGGTRIEPWTPLVGLQQVPALAGIAKRIENVPVERSEKLQAMLPKVETWVMQAKNAVAEERLIPEPPAWPEHEIRNERAPTALYNAMINPVVPYAIRGAIWYQGEANVGEGMLYCEKMKALIGGWRKVWGEDLSFYFVQLAPYRYGRSDGRLPRVWEAQLKSLSIPKTGMAVTTDLVDDLYDIHPKNKLDVGKRLALWALAKDYGRSDIVYSGPLYKAMSIEGDRVRISFDHVGSGLASRDGKALTWFQIAGKDKNFADAEANIEGNMVVVSSPHVTQPVAVRFGWEQLAQPNLINKEGLPASPFRTDDWDR
jgi:sialate O-acetylesterase